LAKPVVEWAARLADVGLDQRVNDELGDRRMCRGQRHADTIERGRADVAADQQFGDQVVPQCGHIQTKAFLLSDGLQLLGAFTQQFVDGRFAGDFLNQSGSRLLVVARRAATGDLLHHQVGTSFKDGLGLVRARQQQASRQHAGPEDEAG